jgi:hypothetical protein
VTDKTESEIGWILQYHCYHFVIDLRLMRLPLERSSEANEYTQQANNNHQWAKSASTRSTGAPLRNCLVVVEAIQWDNTNKKARDYNNQGCYSTVAEGPAF